MKVEAEAEIQMEAEVEVEVKAEGSGVVAGGTGHRLRLRRVITEAHSEESRPPERSTPYGTSAEGRGRKRRVITQ